MSMASHELEGLTLAHGRYWVMQKLGEGGMGTVYRAQDRNIDSEVVIKLPRQAMMDDPEFASRFTREIRSLVKLSHPHIVKVSDVGTWEGTPFAVMQFLPGGTLEDRRPAGPDGQPYPCEPESIPPWLEAVAQALDYIHAQGYVHRDVKPGNILFDAEGHAFLSDFGVAKVLASAADKHPSQTAMTGTGMVLGTPEYMAPELIMGEPFDGRVDQYALAVTVYELLCGRRPFENETKTKILVLHTSKAPPRLTELCPELPDALSQAVLKGLSKDPIERYPSCAALAAAVAATLAGTSAHAGRVKLKCPQCGKTGGMAAADYSRLRKSGGRPSCSVCKVPLTVAAAGTDGPSTGARSGGTTLTSVPGSTGTYAPVSARQPTHCDTAGSVAAARGGTTETSAPRSRAVAPTLVESRPNIPSISAQTIIEMPSPLSKAQERAATPKAAVASKSPNQTTPTPTREATAFQLSGTSHSIPRQKWIAIGGGTGAALLGLTAAVMWLLPRNEAAPANAAANAKTPDVTATRPPSESSPSTTPAEPKAEPRRIAHTEKTSSYEPESIIEPDPDESRSTPKRDVAERRQRGKGPPAKQNVPNTDAATNKSLAAATTAKAKRVRAANPKYIFSPEKLKERPEKKYTLAKYLLAAADYTDKLVIPTGMFHLTASPNDNVDGQRRCLAFERSIHPQKNDVLGLISAPFVELEVEPRLAERLDFLDKKTLAENMSILTLWFSTAGNAMIVKVEILRRYVTGFKKATHFPEGDVDYETLQVSCEGERVGQALDDDWEQPGRLLHFANVYKRRVGAYKKMLQTSQMASLNSFMGSLYQGMLRGAAANELQQQQLRRALTR